MILDKYIFKELLKNQFVVLFVLIAIFSGQSIVRLITEASIGDIPPKLIVSFLVVSLPPFLIFLIPLTLYIAVILTLGRLGNDSEMIAMRATGYSPSRIMYVSLFVALLTSIVMGVISNYLIPKSYYYKEYLETEITHNPELIPIESGRFVSFGAFNIYVEDVKKTNSDGKDAQNVYVVENTPTGVAITVSKDGSLEIDEDGVRWLILRNGDRYENNMDDTLRKGAFSVFRAPISANVNDATREFKTINEMSLPELFANESRAAQAEAQWRIASCIAVFVLTMIAVPLSMVNPRQGRFARLMPAIVIYVAYYMLLMAMHNLISNGSADIYPGMFYVPVLFLICVALPLNLPKKQSAYEMSFLNWFEHVLNRIFHRHLEKELREKEHQEELEEQKRLQEKDNKEPSENKVAKDKNLDSSKVQDSRTTEQSNK